MLAFATNALLARMALGEGTIDAISYTLIRLAAGALVLLPLAAALFGRRQPLRPDWLAALALVTYMVAFSFAYLSLGAGVGALLQAGSIQLTMLLGGLWAWCSGIRVRPRCLKPAGACCCG